LIMGSFFCQSINSEVHSDSSRSVHCMLRPHNTWKKKSDLLVAIFGC